MSTARIWSCISSVVVVVTHLFLLNDANNVIRNKFLVPKPLSSPLASFLVKQTKASSKIIRLQTILYDIVPTTVTTTSSSPSSSSTTLKMSNSQPLPSSPPPSSTTSTTTHTTNNNPEASLPKLNLYWLTFSGIAIWFLFIHTPPFLQEYPEKLRNIIFVVHLLGVSGVYLGCVHNTLLTPSVWLGKARNFHVWIGRIGLILGVFGFLSGLILAWNPKSWEEGDLAFASFITIGGTFQMYFQYKGYTAIKAFQRHKSDLAIETNPERILLLESEKADALREHIIYMVGLFLVGCGIPAIIRVLNGDETLWHIFLLVGLVNYFVGPYSRVFLPKETTEKGNNYNLPSDQPPTSSTPLV